MSKGGWVVLTTIGATPKTAGGDEMRNCSSFLVQSAQAMKRNGPHNVLIAAVAAIMLLLAGALGAYAEEESLPDRFMLRLGGYHARNADTIMRLDANNLPVGTYIDFHETLGGDTTTTVVRADALYRFNDHHALGFSWYDLKFTGVRSLSKDIVWNDQTYTASTVVDSKIKFDIYKLNYQYSVYHNEKVELGALIGFHVMRVFAGISASGINEAQSQAITAPLPVWGLFADYNFTPRFSVYYNYQVFFIDYQDKARGGMQDMLFGLEYRLFRHLSLGAAYNRFNLNLELKGDKSTLNLDTGWNGGMVYAAAYF